MYSKDAQELCSIIQADLAEIENKLSALNNQLTSKAKNLDSRKVAINKHFYYIDRFGVVQPELEQGMEVSDAYIFTCNYFKTYQEASKVAAKRLAFHRVINKLSEIERSENWSVDLKDCNQQKFFIRYDPSTNEFSTCTIFSTVFPWHELYSCEAAVQFVLVNMVEDLKLIFEVQ